MPSGLTRTTLPRWTGQSRRLIRQAADEKERIGASDTEIVDTQDAGLGRIPGDVDQDLARDQPDIAGLIDRPNPHFRECVEGDIDAVRQRNLANFAPLGSEGPRRRKPVDQAAHAGRARKAGAHTHQAAPAGRGGASPRRRSNSRRLRDFSLNQDGTRPHKRAETSGIARQPSLKRLRVSVRKSVTIHPGAPPGSLVINRLRKLAVV